MNKLSHLLLVVMVLASVLISACGAAAPSQRTVAQKVQAVEVAFTGVVQTMDGNQWTIDGKIVTVDPSIVRDSPFKVGDTVKVEAVVAQDGSATATRVETPTALDLVPPTQDAATQPADSPEATSETPSPEPGFVASGTAPPIIFDNQGNEAFGTIDSIADSTVVIGGQSFTFKNGAEFKDQILAGDFVKVHFVVNVDGSLSITEIEKSDPAQVIEDNSNSNGSASDDAPNHDATDDHGNDNKSGKDGGSNDHGGSSGHD
jgi:hypothetical protein